MYLELSMEQANEIVLDVEVKQFDGTLITNKVSRPLKRCDKCGVKFATKAFNYCPICAMDKRCYTLGQPSPKLEIPNTPFLTVSEIGIAILIVIAIFALSAALKG